MKEDIMLKKISYTLLSLFLLYTIVGFFILPLVIQSQSSKFVKSELNKDLTIEKISFNPFLFKLSIHNVALNENDKSIISFENLFLDFDLDRTIANKYLHFKKLLISKPQINIEIDENKELNLLRLIPASNTTEPKVEKEAASEPIKLQLDALVIQDAIIDFKDFSRQKPFHTTLDAFNYTFRDLSTLKNSVAAQTLHTKLNETASLDFKGGLSLNPFKMYGTLNLNNFKIAPIWDIVKDEYPISLDENLGFDTSISFLVDYKDELYVALNDTSLTFNNVHIKEKNNIALLDLERLSLEDFHLQFPQKANSKLLGTNFNLFINSGKLRANALVNLEPLNADVELALDKLPLDILNSVLQQNMTIDIKKAFLSTDAKISYKNDLLKANANTTLNDILINHKNKPLIKAKEVLVKGITFDQSKNEFLVSSVDVSNPYAFVQINKKQELNLANLTKKTTVKKSTSTSKSEPLYVKLGPLSVKNGEMTFEDLTLPIHFKIQNHSINGSLSQFDSHSSKPTVVKLDGNIGKYGQMNIAGDLVHSDFKSFTDFKINFQNIALHDLSGYSGKFVGRKIEDGKLSLDLKYYIEKSKLEAKNNLVISKIKLGDKIESPDALSLPLDLAIAILEDRNGIIDLKLPLKGNLDNPEFSVLPIVWQAFTNIIAKAITAPFSLLGSLFGFGEDEINQVPFYFGNNTIAAIQKEPLDKIVEILQSRTKLAIEINPTYDEKNDLFALQSELFKKETQTALAKIKKEDYQKELLAYLEKSYEKFGEKTKTLKTKHTQDKLLNERSYKEELENFLIHQQIVAPSELENLAKQRVLNIKAYLEKQGIPKEQIVLLNDISLQNEKSSFCAVKLKLGNIK